MAQDPQKARERHNAASNAYRLRNLEKTRASCRKSTNERYRKQPEIAAERNRRYALNNPSKRAQWEAARRARLRGAIPSWAEQEKMDVVYRKAEKLGLTVDHIVPLTHDLVCGLHVWHNLQLLANTENTSKKNRHWPDMP